MKTARHSYRDQQPADPTVRQALMKLLILNILGALAERMLRMPTLSAKSTERFSLDFQVFLFSLGESRGDISLLPLRELRGSYTRATGVRDGNSFRPS